jgi:hypothetical protein
VVSFARIQTKVPGKWSSSLQTGAATILVILPTARSQRLKRRFGNNMSVCAQMVVALKAFVEHCVSLVPGHPFDFSWLDVSQTDVFHPPSPLVADQQRDLARRLVQAIVAGHRENRQQSQTLLQRLSAPEEQTL